MGQVQNLYIKLNNKFEESNIKTKIAISKTTFIKMKS